MFLVNTEKIYATRRATTKAEKDPYDCLEAGEQVHKERMLHSVDGLENPLFSQ